MIEKGPLNIRPKPVRSIRSKVLQEMKSLTLTQLSSAGSVVQRTMKLGSLS